MKIDDSKWPKEIRAIYDRAIHSPDLEPMDYLEELVDAIIGAGKPMPEPLPEDYDR